jgi:hypothetical protein
MLQFYILRAIFRPDFADFGNNVQVTKSHSI